MHGQSTVAPEVPHQGKLASVSSNEIYSSRPTASCSLPSQSGSQGPSPSTSLLSLKKAPKKWSDVHGKYRCTNVIGQGTYGIVYKAVRRSDPLEEVALKRARLDAFTEFGIPETALREVTILRDLKHENIMSVFEISCTINRLYMVCEYLEMDLKKFIRSCNKTVPRRVVKEITYKILKGLAFCHGHRVMHRDLKPHNILLSQDASRVKLADFGLARPKHAPSKTITHDVVTLWYRSPELLLGDCKYCDAVDVWSVGCIVAEMLSGKALFPGDSEIDTLFKIFRVFGTPTAREWPPRAMDPLSSFPVFATKSEPFATIIPGLDPEGSHFLQSLMRYNPASRLTAAEAMQHSWFDEIRPPVHTAKSKVTGPTNNAHTAFSPPPAVSISCKDSTSQTATKARQGHSIATASTATVDGRLSATVSSSTNTSSLSNGGQCVAEPKDSYSSPTRCNEIPSVPDENLPPIQNQLHAPCTMTAPHLIPPLGALQNSCVSGQFRHPHLPPTCTAVPDRSSVTQQHDHHHSQYALAGGSSAALSAARGNVSRSSWWKWNRKPRSKTAVESVMTATVDATHSVDQSMRGLTGMSDLSSTAHCNLPSSMFKVNMALDRTGCCDNESSVLKGSSASFLSAQLRPSWSQSERPTAYDDDMSSCGTAFNYNSSSTGVAGSCCEKLDFGGIEGNLHRVNQRHSTLQRDNYDASHDFRRRQLECCGEMMLAAATSCDNASASIPPSQSGATDPTIFSSEQECQQALRGESNTKSGVRDANGFRWARSGYRRHTVQLYPTSSSNSVQNAVSAIHQKRYEASVSAEDEAYVGSHQHNSTASFVANSTDQSVPTTANAQGGDENPLKWKLLGRCNILRYIVGGSGVVSAESDSASVCSKGGDSSTCKRSSSPTEDDDGGGSSGSDDSSSSCSSSTEEFGMRGDGPRHGLFGAAVGGSKGGVKSNSIKTVKDLLQSPASLMYSTAYPTDFCDGL